MKRKFSDTEGKVDNQDDKETEGFVTKMISDIRKLAFYRPNQIIWMNKNDGKSAYRATEVKTLDEEL